MTVATETAGSHGWETITLERRGRVGILTLDRPGSRNAVNDQMRSDLREAVDIVAEDESTRGLVITGAGTAFCAGGDIKAMEERLRQGGGAPEAGWRRQRKLHETLEKLFHLDRPTVAAVNGPAYGLGLDLALTCDFVWAAGSASFSSSFVRSGLVPDGGGMFHLPRRVGLACAKELVFSGRGVTASEALSIGLVDRVHEQETLVGEAVAWLEELSDLPATSQALSKGILNRSLELGLEEINVLGSQAQAFCYATPDHLSSVQRFLDGRVEKGAVR